MSMIVAIIFLLLAVWLFSFIFSISPGAAFIGLVLGALLGDWGTDDRVDCGDDRDGRSSWDDS